VRNQIIPKDLKGKALFDFIVKNEALIIHAKKSAIKYSDSLTVSNLFIDEKGSLVSKGVNDIPAISGDATKLNLNVVINTTNYFDSHGDVHIPGLWNKSLADNKKNGFYLLKSHRSDFEFVIGEGMKGSAKKMAWKDLGFDYTGITEALMFSGVVEKDRNPFMFDQYAKRYVKQHSVGMCYVKIVTCINDDDYPVQLENWNKYRSMVINGDDVDEEGYFWAILEAKVNEGSAVLFGSNDLTPTYSVEDSTEYEEQKQINDSTEEKPGTPTLEQPHKDSFIDFIQQTKFINI
jgi:hypothetical protein